MSAMPTAASTNSERKTGRTSGPCPEGETRRRYDFPVAQAHACRIREEMCVAWSLGWVSMARTRGPKLRTKSESAVSSPAEVADAERGSSTPKCPKSQTARVTLLNSEYRGQAFINLFPIPENHVSRNRLVIQPAPWAVSPRRVCVCVCVCVVQKLSGRKTDTHTHRTLFSSTRSNPVWSLLLPHKAQCPEHPYYSREDTGRVTE